MNTFQVSAIFPSIREVGITKIRVSPTLQEKETLQCAEKEPYFGLFWQVLKLLNYFM
jgi:hypothetical protein